MRATTRERKCRMREEQAAEEAAGAGECTSASLEWAAGRMEAGEAEAETKARKTASEWGKCWIRHDH